MAKRNPDDVPTTQPTQEQLVLDTIMNNIPAMVFYKDLDGVYVAANEMFCHQLQTTPAEIIGKTDFDFFDQDSAQRYRETDLEVIQTGKSVEAFEDEITINGEPRIFTTRKVLLKDHEGKPYGIVGLSYDITDSHRAEQELIESRTKYKYMYNVFRLMADNIPDLLWAKDLRKRYLFANKAICEKLIGADDTEEPIGKTDMFFAERERNTHPDDPDWYTFGESGTDTDELTMRQKAPGRFDESGNVRGQYLFFDIQKAPLVDEDGNIIGTVGSGRDITKQKLMEKEFQDLYQRNRAIIGALPDLMFLFDEYGNYLDAYASNFNELLESPENIIGTNVNAYFGDEVTKKTLEAIKLCLEQETIQTFDYTLNDSSSKKYYEARLIKVDDKKVLCICRNITIQQSLQLELVEAKEKAEESSRLKSTLLNNMSHEIRTPLNGILGFSDIMVNELKDPDYVEMAAQINNSGKRLMKTLDSIMQLSQLESGAKALHTDPVDVEIHLRQILDSFANKAVAKGLYLNIGDIPACHGYLDLFFFNQAISNILENAIKFTQKGGVTIEVAEINRESRRMLLITIEDTGIGISDVHRKIIFDEFRQVSEGQNRNFEGTGLGLTIAVKMIQLLGGDIVVESEMGKGSKFNVTIPFPEIPGTIPEIPANRLSQDKDQVPVSMAEPEQTILLVEDNEVNAKLIHVYLKNKYRIEWARNGGTAIAMVQQQKFDAILMDISLGEEMDGIEATQIIRRLQAYKKIPIIALTGYTMFGDRERLIEAGCTDYLAKPITKSEILSLLTAILPSKPE
jgi:PAS domain S-box-containing protein